jgi:hypothetical protein
MAPSGASPFEVRMYTVRIKSRGGHFSIKNVIADGYIDDRNVRFFIQSDDTRTEVDMNQAVVVFGPERAKMIRESDEAH